MSKVAPEFIKRMQYKLDVNHSKDCPVMNPNKKGRGWKGCKPEWLLGRLKEETRELSDAFAKGHVEGIKNECADVANFAMMLFDVIESEGGKKHG